MRYIISILLAILVGTLLGFFGVFVSVFADGALSERLITIAIILLIYVLLSAALGYLLPNYSWMWGLLLGAPGVFFLVQYMANEPNPYYLIYIILILSLSCLGAKGGSIIKRHKKA